MSTQQPTPDQIKSITDKLKIENQFKGGASWFYWIGGMSIVNSLAILFGANWSFFAGLGATQFIDGVFLAIVQQSSGTLATIIQIVGFGINLGIAGLFILLGVFARRKNRWAFIVGMVVYGLDSLIFLWFRDFIGFAFHIFVFFMLRVGLQALDSLARPDQAQSFAA